MRNIVSILIVSICMLIAEASNAKDAHELMKERMEERYRATNRTTGYDPSLRPRQQGNHVMIRQSGGNNRSSIIQDGAKNSATVVQSGNGTGHETLDVPKVHALRGKKSLKTRYSSDDSGATNASSVIQRGDNNAIEHDIDGQNNNITTEQYGDSMTHIIRHKGSGKDDIVIQHSENN